MKLAILGSSPLALEAALRFHSHGAALSWFNGEEGNWESLFRTSQPTWEEYTSTLGRQLLQEAGATSFDQGSFSWDQWKNRYYLPLVEQLKAAQEVRPHRVLSITKRYLAPQEVIKGSSRFHDLFRLIFEINPEEFIDRQKETDPATYERLSEEFIQSLQSSLEMYEDFDLVLDLRSETLPCSMAVTGRALGEGRVMDNVYYGLDVLRHAPADKTRDLVLVGSGDIAAEALIFLSAWLEDPRMRLFVISDEEDPFADYLKTAREEAKKKLLTVIDKMAANFQDEINQFHTKLREWQELDDFIKAKKPKPSEPIPRLVFFSGHNVTAIDQLIDRRRIFVTVERPDWRHGVRQPENDMPELKTIGADEVLVATGVRRKNVTENLPAHEKGLFGYTPKRPSHSRGWKEDLNALDAIEKEIFGLFSPAPSAQL